MDIKDSYDKTRYFRKLISDRSPTNRFSRKQTLSSNELNSNDKSSDLEADPQEQEAQHIRN